MSDDAQVTKDDDFEIWNSANSKTFWNFKLGWSKDTNDEDEAERTSKWVESEAWSKHPVFGLVELIVKMEETVLIRSKRTSGWLVEAINNEGTSKDSIFGLVRCSSSKAVFKDSTGELVKHSV